MTTFICILNEGRVHDEVTSMYGPREESLDKESWTRPVDREGGILQYRY